jgi:hypothetical protein
LLADAWGLEGRGASEVSKGVLLLITFLRRNFSALCGMGGGGEGRGLSIDFCKNIGVYGYMDTYDTYKTIFI